MDSVPLIASETRARLMLPAGGEARALQGEPVPDVVKDTSPASLAAQPPGPLVAMLELPQQRPLPRDNRGGICEKPATSEAMLPVLPPQLEPEQFGQRLAEAARAQTHDFVVYNNKCRSLRYPMGDVPALFGVCTDVVVRAYRALGVDLQQLVHDTRVGSGDASIDHRRVEVLRRFFAARGESLPVTSFAEDYLPGDIVTYYRPQNQNTSSHIAIVSDVLAPSGRPMIIHNRGWGPQMEDALFVDQITGHYRYYGQGLRKSRETRYGGLGAVHTE